MVTATVTRIHWALVGTVLAGISLAFGMLRSQQREVANQLQQATRDGIHEGVRDALQESAEQARKLPSDTFRDAREALSAHAAGQSASRPVGHDPIASLFDLGEHLAKSADDVAQQILRLSPEECRQIGERTHRLILADRAALDDPQVSKCLKQLSGQLIIHDASQCENVCFTVLDSKVVNAFSHVGNYIYVNQRLLELVTADDELQFVLGHELAHFALGHCDRQVTYSARAEQIAGDIGQLAQFAYSAIAVCYGKEQEFDADSWSMMALEKMGRPRSAAITALQLIGKANDSGSPASTPARPLDVPDRIVNHIDRHFRSHPATIERIQRLLAADYGR